MCGLVALTNTGASANFLAALQALEHRGPDDSGWLSWTPGAVAQAGRAPTLPQGRVLLGHQRLSILDLSALGHQPMSSADGRYHLVYNGEVYNYRELRLELEQQGCVFHSQSDSEVLLQALIVWGKQALLRLRGMFAFVLLDTVQERLLAGRDFFGIKPLFYARWFGGFAFASELSALQSLPGISRDLNAAAAYNYLLSGVTDRGDSTFVQGIRQLPAAHWLELDIAQDRIVACERYWRIDLAVRKKISFEQACHAVREKFLESVALHLRSDVPVGAALSGGIDSSAIVCAIRHLHPQQEIHTFTFVSEEAASNEEHWADIVNQHCHAVAHKIHCSEADLLADLPRLLACQGEPFGSTSIYAQHRVFQAAAAAGIKVMLDGQGADEMLAGYVSYQGSRLASLVAAGRYAQAWQFAQAAGSWPGRSPAQLWRAAVAELLPDGLRGVARRASGRRLPPPGIRRDWLQASGVDPIPPAARKLPAPDYLRARLLETLENSSLPALLRYEDRNSMAFSVESRVPFLHVDFVELVYALPEDYLIGRDGTSKHIFREAMRGLVPDVILDRRDKIGFATPENLWLRRLDATVRALLASANPPPCLDMPYLTAEWQRLMTGEERFDSRVWRWLNFLDWYAGQEGLAS